MAKKTHLKMRAKCTSFFCDLFSNGFCSRCSRGIGFSHGLRPWKYLREGGAINQ
jgi:hypothetical protein